MEKEFSTLKENLPIPKHLQALMLPIGNDNSEFKVTGKMKCPCGVETFEIWESNNRQTHCIKLKKEALSSVMFSCEQNDVLLTGKHRFTVASPMLSLHYKDRNQVSFVSPDISCSVFWGDWIQLPTSYL